MSLLSGMQLSHLHLRYASWGRVRSSEAECSNYEVRSASCNRSSDPGIALRQKILARLPLFCFFASTLPFINQLSNFHLPAAGGGGSLGTGSQVLGGWRFGRLDRIVGSRVMEWCGMQRRTEPVKLTAHSTRFLYVGEARFHRIVPTRQFSILTLTMNADFILHSQACTYIHTLVSDRDQYRIAAWTKLHTYTHLHSPGELR